MDCKEHKNFVKLFLISIQKGEEALDKGKRTKTRNNYFFNILQTDNGRKRIQQAKLNIKKGKYIIMERKYTTNSAERRLFLLFN